MGASMEKATRKRDDGTAARVNGTARYMRKIGHSRRGLTRALIPVHTVHFIFNMMAFIRLFYCPALSF